MRTALLFRYWAIPIWPLGMVSFLTWDFLGYRFYFPNPDGMYTGQTRPVSKMNIISKPVFDHRRIWYGYEQV
jgi:hypothetical protein